MSAKFVGASVGLHYLEALQKYIKGSYTDVAEINEPGLWLNKKKFRLELVDWDGVIREWISVEAVMFYGNPEIVLSRWLKWH